MTNKEKLQLIEEQLNILEKKVNVLKEKNNFEWTQKLKNMNKDEIKIIIATDVFASSLNLSKIKSEIIHKLKKIGINYIPKSKKNLYILDYRMLPIELNLNKNKNYSIIFVKKLSNNKFDYSKQFKDYLIKILD